jgi:hypothetical protein
MFFPRNAGTYPPNLHGVITQNNDTW